MIDSFVKKMLASARVLVDRIPCCRLLQHERYCDPLPALGEPKLEEPMSHVETDLVPQSPPTGPLAWYRRVPLYLRILLALILGVGVGLSMGAHAALFKPFSAVVLRLLG